MDVKGRVHLADGREVKVVTGIDDHARFVVCASAVAWATARPVVAALMSALKRHGIPEPDHHRWLAARCDQERASSCPCWVLSRCAGRAAGQ